MVIKNHLLKLTPRGAPPQLPLGVDALEVRGFSIYSKLGPQRKKSAQHDVIDLGAPRIFQQAALAHSTPRAPGPRPRPYRSPSRGTPRFKPGRKPRAKPPPAEPRAKPPPAEPRAKPYVKPRAKLLAEPRIKLHDEPRGKPRPKRRAKPRVFRRALPNPRLYQPPPRRPLPLPPPPRPHESWPAPAPPACLETASLAALRLNEQRLEGPPPLRLVVTVPSSPSEPGEPRAHAERTAPLLSLDTDSGDAMAAGNRHSTSPDDCSEGNEAQSAPSEFLAEFLSAIMRRQYAEALKYCRLILQYEPHNATARGFYPLLQHKVHNKHPEGAPQRDSSSEEASVPSDKSRSAAPPSLKHELMEQSADESDASEGESRSSASQSSLELDSSEALSLSRRTDSAWESSTGTSASRSDADDNGNVPPAPLTSAPITSAPAPAPPANDNEGEASALRRLRAHFTCSIK